MLADVELGRRGVERTTKHQSRQGAKILIKEAAANYQVEYRSWVLSGGWHTVGSATSKTNCPRTNWKIYRSGCEPGKALNLDYFRSKKSSISKRSSTLLVQLAVKQIVQQRCNFLN